MDKKLRLSLKNTLNRNYCLLFAYSIFIFALRVFQILHSLRVCVLA